MGAEVRTHIGFVTEIIATAMETAIFAYLGLFLFSSRYHWNIYHTMIAILGCCMSRGIMIPCLSFFANSITKMQALRESCRNRQIPLHVANASDDKAVGSGGPVIIDKKMQVVLWMAGLRDAMSFALCEDIPLYDSVTGEGSRWKSELKAMTSASILFTIFILGGCTYSVMEALGMAPSQASASSPSSNRGSETTFLLSAGMPRSEDETDSGEGCFNDDHTTSSNSSAKVRQRTLVQQKTY